MKTALRFGWIALCLTLTFAVRCWNIRDVFVQGHIYFLDPDCYSRMTRARMVDEHPGTIIRHQDFENWPQGVDAHTTAPFDYLIVGLKRALDGLFRLLDPQNASLLHAQTLDLAGALISPLLGVAGALFLAWWLAKFRVRYAWAALLFYAFCPILVHGTVLGRPDHQSLLMFTLTVAIGAELALARYASAPSSAQDPAQGGRQWWYSFCARSASPEGSRTVAGDNIPGPSPSNGCTPERVPETQSFEPRRKKPEWGLCSGIAWGLSLWVSLYEPIILLAIIVALWLILDRKAFLSRQRLPGAVALLCIVLLSLLVEGWPVSLPGAEVREYFGRWEGQIGELSHLSVVQLFDWIGWWGIASLVLLWIVTRDDRRGFPMLILLACVAALSMWQARWGYFLGIVFAWTLPWQMQALRRGWAAWVFFLVGSWPLLKDWDARLYPDAVVLDHHDVEQGERAALRDLAEKIIGVHGGAFLASWWLSPAIAYWSHQPGVAGSSHESLSGIVDSARFFMAVDPTAAAGVLRKRRVTWIVADDPQHELDTASSLLGAVAPGTTMAATLFDHPEDAPEWLVEWSGRATVRPDGLRFYRVYQVNDAKLPTP